MDNQQKYFLFITELVVLALGVLDVPVALAECQHPPEIDGAQHNLTASPPFPDATVASYHCLTGYRDSGTSRTFTCNQEAWTGGNLQCHEILCDFIDAPENGIITNSPTYRINTIIQFGCHTGYTLTGHASRRCAIDGWTRSTPSCDVVMCNEFEGVAHGHIFQEAPDGIHNDYGSQITVTCDEGYQLSGPSRITCGADGQWSQSPRCEPSTCPPYQLSNSPCTKEYATYGTMYYLLCVDETANVSVTRTGPDSTVCMDNNWSDTDMACYCNCKVRADPDRVRLQNVDDAGFLAHGEVLAWSCRSGGSKATSEDLVCNDGVMEQPLCIIPTTTTTTSTTSTTTISGTKPTSTDLTSGASTVSKMVDLLTVSTTQPASPEIFVCSCRCDVLKDVGLVEEYKRNNNNMRPEKDWTCYVRMEHGGYECSVEMFGVVLCRSQGQPLSDIASVSQTFMANFCKCKPKTSYLESGTRSFHNENASFTFLFLLVLCFIYM